MEIIIIIVTFSVTIIYFALSGLRKSLNTIDLEKYLESYESFLNLRSKREYKEWLMKYKNLPEELQLRLESKLGTELEEIKRQMSKR